VTRIVATRNVTGGFTSRLEPTTSDPLDRRVPWAVQLAGDRRCLAFQGAHATYHGPTLGDAGRVYDYYCLPGGDVGVLRGFDERHPRWRAAVVDTTNGPVHTEPVTTAWFGDPAAGVRTPIR
jgi:hypothetical protein